MRSFVIITNSIKDPGLVITDRIASLIEKEGGTVSILPDEAARDEQKVLDDAECAIVLGGDGTILRVAGEFSERDIPIVGVNLGTLGFLAEVDQNNVGDMVKRLIDDSYTIENRIHLEGTVYRDGKPILSRTSLNDVVITRAGNSRLIGLKIYVNGELSDIYEADGVICATPTGSTGYNLSAGGPIVSPNTDIIILTPVSPHSLTSKSIVFSNRDVIEVEIDDVRPDVEAFVNFDGSNGISVRAGDRVRIGKADSFTKLIKLYKVGFYEVLRAKLK